MYHVQDEHFEISKRQQVWQKNKLQSKKFSFNINSSEIQAISEQIKQEESQECTFKPQTLVSLCLNMKII